MGDAVRDGDVHASDPEDTIDAASSRPEPAASSMPFAVVAATRDHTQLIPVERQHYAITREIARGGIGRVFEARDLRLGRQVAIKELLPQNRDAARRFEREARITAKLQHPAIIHVYEAGVWPGGEPFYAMPLVAGRSLDKVVAERKTLDERLGLLPNVIAVADALAYAHNAHVIHRDLKPANVLVGEFGETVVIDWGLAKDLTAHSEPQESLQMNLRASAEQTLSGGVVGTPAYMPPEQARGEPADERADVYALGALLYKVLSGVPPYCGSSSRDVLEHVKAGPPPAVQEREPAAPPDLVAIVAKAMARDPDDRYVTAAELAQDLKRFETGQLVGAHRYTTGELMLRWLRRYRVAVSIAAAALLVLLGFGAFTVQKIVAEKRRADSERNKANAGRANLLEERGRVELLDGHAGAALAYLVGAAEDRVVGGARGFLIADAMRPFAAELAYVEVGAGDVALAVSPDGRQFATAGAGTMELRTIDGALVRTFGQHGVTRVVAFDASGTRLVAAGDDGVARVWTLDGRRIAELRGHAGAILAATFSHDGHRVVTAGQDASVRVWDLATQTSSIVDCHLGPVHSVRMSPDGDRVLTASDDWTACIINIGRDVQVSPRIERTLKGHTGPVNSADWSPDGTLAITASNDGTARVWSVATGKPVTASLHSDDGSIVQIALMSRDGLIVTGGNDLTVRIWELPSVIAPGETTAPALKQPRKLVGHTARIVTAALSADHRLLVTGGFDGLAKIWELHSGQELATFEHGDAVNAAVFVPGAVSRLASSSRDGTARIWDANATRVRADLDASVNAIAIARDGTVAVAFADVVKLLRGGEEIELHGHLGSVLAVAFSPDGARLVTAGEDARALVWDARTGKQVGALGDHPEPTNAVAFAPTGDRVALLVGGAIEVWTLAGARVLELAAPGGGVLDGLAIHPTTGVIAGIGRDGTLVLWDARGTLLASMRDRSSPHTAVAFAPAGDAIVTAGSGTAHIWKLRGDAIDTHDVITLEGGLGSVRAVLVTPDGSRVITGGDNGRAMIWDRYKGKLLARRDRHAKPITALALRGDELWIGSADHTLSSWNIRVETGSVASLREFMQHKHVPVELQVGDVVRKRVR